MSKAQNRAIFLESIVHLCDDYNASVTSWIRSEKHNRLVGGHPRSQHLTGTAVDVIVDSQHNKTALIEAARKLQLIALDEGNHIHIQLYKAKP